ncbi:hypothetical protein SAMD00019534_004550 [Acytostelium subglobosum LB1]|uniref:hypothetical protein n=1 Tax=Acytostelium subglobosum LB1 TaxID=1410327 RepID=UPI000644AD5F|nr:hypothetical protein SAMD00019534_004550 [Acytostelium subglobosum LB1]GAM17280.1 hypothetical protein SAMD00019534_004550 [Acytostelium subglobosum LB1]|eukprot:XP_012759342.1 hypothetical protein SAMD00019534_004550 [Acytostelium subglobosum LB1]
MLCTEPIDVVYTWVNGSDANLINAVNELKRRTRDPLLPPCTEKQDPSKHECYRDENPSSRFIDNQELKYSLRSIEKHAPWVRHVYIVTNGQVPSWLNLDNPKVSIVTHEDIFVNKSHLPTFSSPSIETHLHRIPGLSKKFLYLNDDVMFGRPVFPDDFMTRGGGQRVFLSWPVPNCNDGCPNNWVGDGFCDPACNTTMCDFDGGDCDNSTGQVKSRYWRGGTTTSTTSNTGTSNHKTSGSICSRGCPDSWVGDKHCDRMCKNVECGFDAGDCGTEVMVANMVGYDITNKTTVISVANSTTSVYFNLTNLVLDGTITDGSHDNAVLVRTATISQKHKIMTLTFHQKIAFQVVSISISYDTTGTTFTKRSLVKEFTVIYNSNSTVEPDTTVTPLVTIGNVTQLDTTTTTNQTSVNNKDTINQTTTSTTTTTTDDEEEDDEDEVDDEVVELNVDNKDKQEQEQQQKQQDIYNSTYNRIKNQFEEMEPIMLGDYEKKMEKAIAEAVDDDDNSIKSNKTGGRSLMSMPETPLNDDDQEDQLIEVKFVARPTQNNQMAMMTEERAKQKALELLQSQTMDDPELQAIKKYTLNRETERRVKEECGEVYPWEEIPDELDGLPLNGKRKLMDMFGDSLKFVNRLLTVEFGVFSRKVPAHMPHMIDKDLMEEIQQKWPAQWERTSSHSLRNPRDMQYAFTYFYYLMHKKVNYDVDTLWNDDLDFDKDGILNENEMRSMAVTLFGAPLKGNTFKDFKATLYKACLTLRQQRQLDRKEILVMSPVANITEELFDAQLAECPITLEVLKSSNQTMHDMLKVYAKRTKYRTSIEGTDEVAFFMVDDNHTTTQTRLDGIRQKRHKFICLNDNINHDKPNTELVIGVVHNFYQSLFPFPSSFELPANTSNSFMYLDEYRAKIKITNELEVINQSNNQLVIIFGVLIVFVLILIVRKIKHTSSKEKNQHYIV